jgi:hypothetical protein
MQTVPHINLIAEWEFIWYLFLTSSHGAIEVVALNKSKWEKANTTSHFSSSKTRLGAFPEPDAFSHGNPRDLIRVL